MAKFMIAALALIAGIGLIEASPVLNLLGGGTSQVQGLSGGGSLVGLVTGVPDALLSTIRGLTHSRVRTVTNEQVEPAMQAVVNSVTVKIIECHSRGGTREQCAVEGGQAGFAAARPSVELVIRGATETVISQLDWRVNQGTVQGLGGSGRK